MAMLKEETKQTISLKFSLVLSTVWLAGISVAKGKPRYDYGLYNYTYTILVTCYALIILNKNEEL